MKKTPTQKAFGIIEVLIAAAIISVVLVSTSILGRNVLAGGQRLENRTKAMYLAQEGIELTRQIRDTNKLRDSNWDDFQLNTTHLASYVNTNGLVSGRLTYDIALRRYQFVQGSAETITVGSVAFVRTIIFEKAQTDTTSGILQGISNPNESAIKVTIKVTWDNGRSNFEISEILTNWNLPTP
jgi:prepilin-type N-terminal cleavage/methylation domain-containing protein